MLVNIAAIYSLSLLEDIPLDDQIIMYLSSLLSFDYCFDGIFTFSILLLFASLCFKNVSCK